jgi:hypothetical protein
MNNNLAEDWTNDKKNTKNVEYIHKTNQTFFEAIKRLELLGSQMLIRYAFSGRLFAFYIFLFSPTPRLLII